MVRAEGTTQAHRYLGLDYLTYWRIGSSVQCLRRNLAAAMVVVSPVAARIPAAAMVVVNSVAARIPAAAVVVMSPVVARIPAATMLGQSATPAIPAAPG